MTGSLLSDQFRNMELDNTYVSMLAILYIDGYVLGFEIEIMINFDI